MKILKKYYKKIYRHTNRLLKKVFGLNVTDSMAESYRIKTEIETEIDKPIEMITKNDLIEKKLSHQYCKYRTLENILSVVSGALFFGFIL